MERERSGKRSGACGKSGEWEQRAEMKFQKTLGEPKKTKKKSIKKTKTVARCLFAQTTDVVGSKSNVA